MDKYFEFKHRYNNAEVSVKLHGDLDIQELLQEFTQFLRGCGYSFDGILDLVNEDYTLKE